MAVYVACGWCGDPLPCGCRGDLDDQPTVTVTQNHKPQPLGLVGGSVSAETRVLELKAALLAKAILLADAQEDLIRAIASDDGDAMCAAASSVQSIGYLIGEAARQWRRSTL